MLSPKRRQYMFEERSSFKCHAGANPELTRLAFFDTTYRCRKPLGVPQHARRGAVQLLARGGEMDATMAVDEQFRAQQSFECFDVKGDCRLRQVKRGGRRGKAAVIGHGHEHLQSQQAQTRVQVT